MARYVLVSGSVLIEAPTDMDDGKAAGLIEVIEDQLEMGLEAVGRSIVEKFADGKLAFRVSV